MSRMYRGSQTMLLCIDDSEALLEYEGRRFEQSGYFMLAVASAPRGLRLATEFSFGAILLDYHMPEINGHEFASEIKRLRPAGRVVRVSGSEIPEEIRQLVDAVVPKEKAARELLPTVRAAVSGVSRFMVALRLAPVTLSGRLSYLQPLSTALLCRASPRARWSRHRDPEESDPRSCRE
jgi:CheY-like chemotaxis protein